MLEEIKESLGFGSQLVEVANSVRMSVKVFGRLNSEILAAIRPFRILVNSGFSDATFKKLIFTFEM